MFRDEYQRQLDAIREVYRQVCERRFDMWIADLSEEERRGVDAYADILFGLQQKVDRLSTKIKD